ncbi:amidase family protein, partial [Ralstonia pseudosolanacearum]|uniref:amidase family protein n=1 Tax=Ralstonia pseudosolanacearum TaxID=1310165 RepID=UPI003CED6545
MMTPRPNMIRALAAELAAGHTTSIALTEAALARAQSHRAAGGAAYIDIDARAALDMARAADAARAAGNVPSLLAGLPVSIKDLFDVAGQVTAAGSRALAHQSAATSDATAVARLRAGVVGGERHVVARVPVLRQHHAPERPG